ncbi:MAG TPA: hypothetical protein VKB34_18450 [Povalibacter sp.]|nr:hypothetical protein [Povalibacter sp.]
MQRRYHDWRTTRRRDATLRAVSRRSRLLLIASLIGWSSMPIHGEDAPLDWTPVASESLEDLRGGFETDGGLQVSFGIERATYINGELVARTSATVRDVGTMTVEEAQALDQAANSVVLIQNGPNNTFDVGAVAAGTTVIQNTLNDQHIVNMTSITADVNSLSTFQAINVQESLQQALNRVMGGR